MVSHKDGQADRGPETSSFELWGCSNVEQQPSALHLPRTIATFPFLHDFCSQFCSFGILLLFSILVYFHLYFNSFFLFFKLLLDLPLPSSLDLALTVAAKLPEAQCYFLFCFFLTVNTLSDKPFIILCNNVQFFLFGTKVNAYLNLCVCVYVKGIFILLFYFCRVLNFVYEKTFPPGQHL